MNTRRAAGLLLAAVAALLATTWTHVAAQETPRLLERDRIRLAEAFRLGEELGEQVWPGWASAPFDVLLVTPEYEFLIRHPKPSDDFQSLGHDALLHSDVYFRKRVFPPNLLATFPAVGGISTIVIGQAENTSVKTSTPWVVTLLHEHFHQWQDSQPGLNEEVAALNLARGDESGMWMLNFPFPYASPPVRDKFDRLSRALFAALEANDGDNLQKKAAEYRSLRKELEQSLAADDFKYFSFQLWKEGIARYTEFRIAGLAAEKFKPSAEFASLPDFTPFQQVADGLLTRIRREIQDPKLDERQRVIFYAFGAAEGLLLDRVNPRWQQRYMGEKFFLDRYFPQLPSSR